MNEDSYLIEAIRAPRFDPYRTCGARNARGPLPPSKLDYEALLKPHFGKTYRHKFTTKKRHVRRMLENGKVLLIGSTGGIERSPRKALDWLRNAVEV